MKAWLLILTLMATQATAEVLVIGNSKTGLATLTSAQVEDIFMGRTRSFPNGRAASPLDQTGFCGDFYHCLVSRPLEQVDAYWARIVFTGKNTPPPSLANDQAVLDAVRRNEGAIGYISPTTPAKDVQVLLVLH